MLQLSGFRRPRIPVKTLTILLVSAVLWSTAASAKCIPFEAAEDKIGDQTCVTGKVVKVAQSKGGTFFLNFCENYRTCPFTVVVFPSNLKDVGDVRQLEGKTIEIYGRIQLWRGHAEIVLRDSRQLKGEAAKLPPVPKEYDVERKGKFSPRAPAPQKKSPRE
jgi:hypothetical protein